jgi:sugar lactone lactonase YvrE
LNGLLLVTLISSPEVWEVDPRHRTAELVHRFPHTISVTGIAEYEPDVFSVAVGNWSYHTFKPDNGSWSVWSIDMNARRDHRDSAIAKKVADMPNAVFLNGMTALPTDPGSVLIGDSGLGVVYHVKLKSGEYSIAIDDPALKPNLSAAAVLGVNGIHWQNNNLYFTNSFQAPVLGRIPLHTNGTAAGPTEILVANATGPTNLSYHGDDFAIDSAGDIWLTSDVSGGLSKISPNGQVVFVGGGPNDSVIAGDTAVAFGRTPQDHHTLYITTNGGLADPGAAGIVGGKVVTLDTREL